MVEIMTGPDGRNLSHYPLIIIDNSNHITYHNDDLRYTTEGLVIGRRMAPWCHDAVCSLHSISRESRYATLATPTLHLTAGGFWHSEICEPIIRTSLLNTKHIVGSQRRQLVSLLISNPSESFGPITSISNTLYMGGGQSRNWFALRLFQTVSITINDVLVFLRWAGKLLLTCGSDVSLLMAASPVCPW